METTALFILAVTLVVLVQIAGVLVYALYDLGRVLTAESKLQYRKALLRKAKKAHTAESLVKNLK